MAVAALVLVSCWWVQLCVRGCADCHTVKISAKRFTLYRLWQGGKQCLAFKPDPPDLTPVPELLLPKHGMHASPPVHAIMCD